MVLERTSGVTQSSWHAPELGRIQSEPYLRDYGHSFNIPWVMPHTAGFWTEGTIPTEKKLIMSDVPEYFATNDIIPSTGGLPVIDPSDPIYQYEREQASVPMKGSFKLIHQ